MEYGVRNILSGLICLPYEDLLAEIKSTNMNVSFFGRYNLSSTERFNFFVNPYVKYGVRKTENKYDGEISTNVKTIRFSIGLSGGILYRAIDKFYLVARFGNLFYQNGKYKNEPVGEEKEEYNFSSFTASLNASTIFFGVEFAL